MTTFYKAEDLPLATHDTVVTIEIEHGVKVQRKVMAGTRVPPDLIDAYNAATGESATAPSDPEPEPEPQLEDLKRPELDAMARELGIDEPEKLPNKGAVVTAIEAKQAE